MSLLDNVDSIAAIIVIAVGGVVCLAMLFLRTRWSRRTQQAIAFSGGLNPVRYAFRLRFKMNKAIDADGSVLMLTKEGVLPPFTLTAQNELRDAHWFSIRGGGYATEQEARMAALMLADIFLCLGVERGAGIDVGRGVITTGLGEGFRQKLEAELGARVRNELHGIDVFEDGEVRFASFNFELTVRDTPGPFLECFQKLMAYPPQLSNRQRICLELINDSLFESSTDAQLVLRVSAIEALCERAPRPEVVRNLLSMLIMQLPEDAADEVRNALTRAAEQSIGEACRAKVRKLLGEEREQEFRSIYRARNRLVHDGVGRGQNGEQASKAMLLVRDLARAEIRYPPCG
jgi:hypothetical protein